MNHPVACTILSKNYIAFARVLAESFLRHHPDGKVIALLTDGVDGYFDKRGEPFEFIELEEIGIANLPSMRFKFSILELNTAVKPFFLRYIFKKYACTSLIYLDPDILVLAELKELLGLLERYSIIITPHITSPYTDDYNPDEVSLLRGGAYNLGFLALANNKTTAGFLDWWGSRTYDNCLVALEQGLFLDQKWIDLVPGLFEGVFILRAPGYNAAYWNMHERRIMRDGEEFKIGGRTLYFYHFSGFDPEKPDLVSKNQNRFKLNDLIWIKPLFTHYRDLLYKHGYAETHQWPYTYATFINGVAIPHFVRRYYHSFGTQRTQFGNPFSADGGKSFLDWLNAPARSGRSEGWYISNLLLALYEARPDIQRICPDLYGKDFENFCVWAKTWGKFEESIDEEFLRPLRSAGSADGDTGGRKEKALLFAWRLFHSGPTRKLLHVFRLIVGEKVYAYIRKKVRYLFLGYR